MKTLKEKRVAEMLAMSNLEQNEAEYIYDQIAEAQRKHYLEEVEKLEKITLPQYKLSCEDEGYNKALKEIKQIINS